MRSCLQDAKQEHSLSIAGNYKHSLIMRQYQPIWSQLKTKHLVSITANRRFHARIIKAVVKEKWMDVAYKIAIEPDYSLLSHTIVGSVLTFHLKIKQHPLRPIDLGLEDIFQLALEDTPCPDTQMKPPSSFLAQLKQRLERLSS